MTAKVCICPHKVGDTVIVESLEDPRCPKCDGVLLGEYRINDGTEKPIRTFETGATRDTNADKPDYEGFLSPTVLKRFGEYMHKHRKQSDGNLRASDNWQKGIPKQEYMKSGWRHFMDLWLEHRGLKSRDGLEDALCALLFNVMGYLYEHLKEKEKE